MTLVVSGCASTEPLPTGTSTPGPPLSGPQALPSGTAAPALLAASSRVTAFFYLWYGTPDYDGAWRHWNQLQHTPPDNIASSFYPERGPYSSRDPVVLFDQMNELRQAGIGVIAVSWWGKGSWEDQTLEQLFAQANTAGIKIAFHLEPYEGQTAASMAGDIRYLLGKYGGAAALYRVSRPTAGDPSKALRPVFYVFGSSRMVPADLQSQISSLRQTSYDAIIMVHSPKAVSATRVGADGVYTYDAMAVPGDLAQLVSDCRADNLICSPSVAPGFDDRQAVAQPLPVLDRANGARYDQMWQAVLGANSDWVSVTTFNEWHEGTQIEPARDYSAGDRTYTGYEGAYDVSAAQAPDAYLIRTAYWVKKLGGGQ